MAKKQQRAIPEPTIAPDPVDVPVEQPEPETPQHAPDETLFRVQVLRLYQGRRTNEQPIQPGLYESDDPALYGLADYLVENGHAILVTG